MPLLTGAITRSGAVVDALIGVTATRRGLLTRNGFTVPQAVPVRALIDTGASISGCSPRIFQLLDIRPVQDISILTPSTRPDAPHVCGLYRVSWSLVAGGVPHTFSNSLDVILADGFHPDEGIDALIGRDILARCAFQYWGPDGSFHFSF